MSRTIPIPVSFDKPSVPICRDYLNSKCTRGKQCALYHPPFASPIFNKEKQRELGKCFCGADQRKVLRKKIYTTDDDGFIFFVVCNSTGRSIYKCK